MSDAAEQTSVVSTTPNPATAFDTARDYVTRFYPLWFTYNQARSPHARQLVGPDRISPAFQVVVAINVDTLYVSCFPDLSDEPYVITIPETPVTYSILVLDVYGNIIQNNIEAGTPGVYALVGPSSQGRLPAGLHVVPLPVDYPMVVLRADKHKGQTSTIREAEQFRRALKSQTLSNYLKNPSGGPSIILPESEYAIPFKTAADRLIAEQPLTFLKQLQTAVSGAPTPPLDPEAHSLAETFNHLLAWGEVNADLEAGAQAAHQALVQNYLTHTLPGSNWINFTNMGHWGSNYLDRASITEYIQYGNGYPTAAYFQAFVDGSGQALNGGGDRAYKLRFKPEQIPQATRFWSVTAYTPEAIQPIPNSEQKYAVASYTKDFLTDPNAGCEIFISHKPPAEGPTPGWLPVSDRQFNLMLRVYGPTGAVLDQEYTPPAIEPV